MSAARSLVALFILCLSSSALAQGDYLNHLIFSNSTTSDSDFYTGARAVEPSTLEARDGRLPVESVKFITPPNALRLHWHSVAGGSWDAEVRTVSVDNRTADFYGDTLSFWVYAEDSIDGADLPQLELLDAVHNFTDPIALGQFVRDCRRDDGRR